MATNLQFLTEPYTVLLLSGKTATGAGTEFFNFPSLSKTYLAKVTGTGAVSATIEIQVSNDGVDWLTGSDALMTITLSGTTSAQSGGAIPAASWQYIRANVTAISGTGASVDCTVGGRK